MKTLKILSLFVFLIFLVNTASAVVVYGEWGSNQAQSISIEDSDSVDFSAFFGTIAPPMAISIKLYSGNDLIHTFKDAEINQKTFAQTYTVNQAIYSRPGDYEVRIYGSDSYGDMSTTLYLDVINYPPEITSDPVIEVEENKPYSYDVNAIDPDNHPLTYSLSVNPDSPDWLSINSQTGLITGTAPNVVQDTNFDVKVVVSDGIDTDIQSYILTVIWIPNPSFIQTFEFVEDIKVKYNVVFSEVDSARLEIYYKEFGLIDYGTEPITTRQITTSPYTETFDFYEIHQKTKGDYRFIIRDLNTGYSETDDIAVPDYIPGIDLGSIDTNFDEEDSLDIILPVLIDINPEDNPVDYLSASSFDGKTNVSLDTGSNLLTITGNRDSTGVYAVEIGFGHSGVEMASNFLYGNIYDLIDISGVLENNEDDTRIQGVIRVYYQDPDNDSNYIPLEINQIYEGSIVEGYSGKIETTLDGDFSFQVNEEPSELDEIVLQARIGTAEDDQGYVRTITLDSDDSADVLVRAVPYAPYEDDPALFRQFVSELTGDQPSTRFDFEGEYLPEVPGFENYTGLIGIEILSENPFGAENGTFTEPQQINIKNKILNQSDISGIIGDYSISEEQVSIINGSEGHFIFYEQEINPKGKVLADPGWIIVVPYKNLPGFAGLAEPRGIGGGLVYGGTIYLQPVASNKVISHEFGHIFIGSSHPTIMPNQTVMNLKTTLSTTGPADKKAGWLIYEQTYMTFPSPLFPRVDNLYNTLGFGFYWESQISGTSNEYYFESKDDEEDFEDGQSNSNGDDVIDFDDGSFDNSNTNIPYDDTIYLQPNENKKNILTSLSDIIKQVISFIKSVFSI